MSCSDGNDLQTLEGSQSIPESLVDSRDEETVMET